MRIRVPASVANVGPGFDVLAFAVDLWLEVVAEPSDRPRWTFEGEGAEALRAAPNPFSELPFRGRIQNRIPVGVGLGSSAAARVAAAALEGAARHQAFLHAAAQEGHPDNAAAAVYGGFRLNVGGTSLALPVPDVGVALLVAAEPAPTEQARALLPASVPMADAVFNLGHLAMLVDGLHRRDWRQVGRALDDRLHQPYRRRLYPWTALAIAGARESGAFGAAVAGAGPTVFAFCPRDATGRVARAMAEAAPGCGRPVTTAISDSGMSVEP